MKNVLNVITTVLLCIFSIEVIVEFLKLIHNYELIISKNYKV